MIDWNTEGRDLVHNAWIRWYEQKGNDLLLEHIGTIKRAIRWQKLYERSISKSKFMKEGVSYDIQYFDVEKVDEVGLLNHYNPEKEFIFSEIKNELENSLTNERKEVFDLLIQGYNQIEISNELGKSQQIVSYLYNKIKQKSKNIVNA